MKAIILEDEKFASSRLKRMISEVYPEIVVVAIFETILDTAKYILENPNIDIIFMDIHVADGNSFELFQMVNVSSKVIFITAFDKYAIEAFRKNATDYLLKPVKKNQLIEAIDKATTVNEELLGVVSRDYKSRIVIQFSSKLSSIKTSEIAYVFSKNKISYFYTKDGLRYPSDFKLQELEQILDPRLFFRANRQFIVNIDSIDTIRKHLASRLKLTLLPAIDVEIIISTDKTPVFKNWLDR